MQIQKGLVKYKDRSDIVCTYGLTEDGKQYYFLDGNTISNGNIIASTVLVEAIDPVVVASSIGVIDPNGNVVIPFENKSIKLISNELLLVESANPTTPSVVEAIGLRSDPLAATKLVTTPATIKDNMNAKMGIDGRFVFNDQFSEATIYDINGNNLINNEYFSFIGIKNNDTLYFSKNTVDSAVTEYSLTEHMFIAPPTESAVATQLDVQETAVTKDTIDGAMAVEEKNLGFGLEDITAKDFEAVSVEDAVENVPVSDDSIPVEKDTTEVANVESDNSIDSLSTVDAEEETKPVDGDNSVEEVLPVVPTSIESDKEQENVDVSTNDDLTQKDNSEEQVAADGSSVSEEELVKEDTSEGLNSTDASQDQLMSFDFGDNINYGDVEETPVDDVVSNFKSDLFDVDLDSDIFADSTLHEDKIDVNADYSDFSYKVGNTKDTIIEDVATTMSNLINLNRTQRQKIISYEEKFEQASAAYKKVVDKARSQIRDMESLKAKIKNYDTIVAKLEAKIQILENKVHDQDKVIANQTRELETLRPQVEGKEELVRILADAQSLLDQSV